MATYKNFLPDNNEDSRIPYSLPRLITPAIQCSFCGYMWELYTTEFGWTQAEYGIVSRTCTGTQFISFIVFGGIFTLIETFIKGTADTDQSKKKANANRDKLNAAIPIEACGTFIHWLTYFFLIVLPIRWHGVKTPYVDSLFDSASDIQRRVADGPVNLLDMVNSGTMSRKAAGLISIIYIPFVGIWFILYPFMKAFYVIVVNFGAIFWILSWPFKLCRKPKTVDEILPVLETLRDPACSACCNTTCCNNFAMRMKHFGRWMGTRTFFIYLLTFAHGVGVSMHELCNGAIKTYIYPEKQKNKTDVQNPQKSNTAVTGQDGDETTIDVNEGKRGDLGVFNLWFFFIAQLLIILLFSLVKLYVHSKAAFTETFYLISIIFFILQIPILIYFCIGTNYNFNANPDESVTQDGGNPLGNPTNTDLDLNEIPAIAGTAWKDWLKVVCLTVMHGTILFWMFSGAPLTFYISFFVLGGHTGIMSFGLFIINVGLVGASGMFTGITKIPGVVPAAFIGNVPKIVATVCLVAEFLIFLLFYPHNWWWNKRNWVNYILLILMGMINSIFVAYVNIMLDNTVKKDQVKQLKWLAYGGFYSVTNLILTPAMEIMFRSLGHNRIIQCGCKCFRFNYHYCFPTVYKTITGVLMGSDAIAIIAYWLLDM